MDTFRGKARKKQFFNLNNNIINETNKLNKMYICLKGYTKGRL